LPSTQVCNPKKISIFLHHEDNVVFPANGAQCDRVNERVEEDGEDGGDPCDGETARSEGIGPDLAGISDEEGGAERIS
jgi:hypothetical protein